MKKVVIIALVLAIFLGSSLCQAQISPESWVVGTWKGYVDWAKGIWVLEIVEKDGRLAGSVMWATENSKMFATPINLAGNKLTFQNFSKEEFSLDRISDNRMDGKLKSAKGTELNVRFWKEGLTKNSPFLGNWEGVWANNLECSLQVLFVDDTAMTGIYSCKDLPEKNIKGGTNYVNGELAFERKYFVWKTYQKEKFTFIFAQGGREILAEFYSNGWVGNSATFKKK
jgi:hypothetical protein